MAKKAPKPGSMAAFLIGKLTLNTIFNQLVADLAAAGKPGVKPQTTFFDNPPAGLGFSSVFAAQGFLNGTINTAAGKARYNQPADNDILVTEVRPAKTVGNLAMRLFSDQK